MGAPQTSNKCFFNSFHISEDLFPSIQTRPYRQFQAHRSQVPENESMASPGGRRKYFLMAASEGNLGLLKRLVAELDEGQGIGKVSGKVKDDAGHTALHFAASSENSYLTCQFLIENLKADVNMADDKGNTPLHEAILGENRRTVKYLLEKGADVTKTNNKGFTALHYAAEKGAKELLQVLMAVGAEIHANCEAGTPLHCAAAHGKLESLKFLLEKNANPNLMSPLYFTPLMLSILAESLECMELLLKAGADPNVGSLQLTPLCFAASEWLKEVIKCLLKYGANPNTTDSSGMTPLEHAALANFLEGIGFLFPVTSCISSVPDWSISGVMRYSHSDEAREERKLQRKKVFQSAKSKGGDAFKRKDYLDAIYWYSQAVETDPSNATVLSNRSLCWVHLKEGDPALSDAQACVGLRPDWPKAYYREGVAWKLLKNYPMAAQTFSQALALAPDNEEIRKAYWSQGGFGCNIIEEGC